MVSSSRHAITDAAGWPSATSRARLGPVSTADPIVAVVGQHVERDLGHAQQGVALDALRHADDGDVAADRAPPVSQSTARYPCDGTAMTTTSASAHAAARSAVARSDSGNAIPAR